MGGRRRGRLRVVLVEGRGVVWMCEGGGRGRGGRGAVVLDIVGVLRRGGGGDARRWS